MPTRKITPISDCTFSVVLVTNSMVSTPISPSGTVNMMMNGPTQERNRATCSR